MSSVKINNTQLLALCLELQNFRDFDMEGISGEMLIDFVLQNVGYNCTDYELEKEVNQMITDHLIENLYKNGCIEVHLSENDEETYSLTEHGKRVING